MTDERRTDLYRDMYKLDEKRTERPTLVEIQKPGIRRIGGKMPKKVIIKKQEIQVLKEKQKFRLLYNPHDSKDDFKIFWTPGELIHATKVLSRYNVSILYIIKDPIAVKRILHLALLVEKYKPILLELLKVTKYFETFSGDVMDEIIVCIALFDILCRGNGTPLEAELTESLREKYKNCGLKMVYEQIEKDKAQYIEFLYEQLKDFGANSVYELLPQVGPVILNLNFPKIFYIWINKNKLDVSFEDTDLLREAGFRKFVAGKTGTMTYREIETLPYFYKLEVSKLPNFIHSSYYHNKVFILTDQDHCLGMVELVKELLKLRIQKGTIIQTNIQSLEATAYFAYLLSVTFSQPFKLKVYGANKMKKSFESYFNLLNLKNISVFKEKFYIVNPRQKSLAKTTCVLVNPESTFDPSLNIIDETINRGCDICYMQTIYEMFCENDVYNARFLDQHMYDLKELAKCHIQRALTIPQVKFVVYQSFNNHETPDDNLGLNVVNYGTECSHTTIPSIPSDASATEIEDIHYNYCKKLELFFRQGNTVQHVVSPEIWGSDPPFVTILHRIEPDNIESDLKMKKSKLKNPAASHHSIFKGRSQVTNKSHRLRYPNKKTTMASNPFNIITTTNQERIVQHAKVFETPFSEEYESQSGISIGSRISQRSFSTFSEPCFLRLAEALHFQDDPKDFKHIVGLKEKSEFDLRYRFSSFMTTGSEAIKKIVSKKKIRLPKKKLSIKKEIPSKSQWGPIHYKQRKKIENKSERFVSKVEKKGSNIKGPKFKAILKNQKLSVNKENLHRAQAKLPAQKQNLVLKNKTKRSVLSTSARVHNIEKEKEKTRNKNILLKNRITPKPQGKSTNLKKMKDLRLITENKPIHSTPRTLLLKKGLFRKKQFTKKKKISAAKKKAIHEYIQGLQTKLSQHTSIFNKHHQGNELEIFMAVMNQFEKESDESTLEVFPEETEVTKNFYQTDIDSLAESKDSKYDIVDPSMSPKARKLFFKLFCLFEKMKEDEGPSSYLLSILEGKTGNFWEKFDGEEDENYEENFKAYQEKEERIRQAEDIAARLELFKGGERSIEKLTSPDVIKLVEEMHRKAEASKKEKEREYFAGGRDNIAILEKAVSGLKSEYHHFDSVSETEEEEEYISEAPDFQEEIDRLVENLFENEEKEKSVIQVSRKIPGDVPLIPKNTLKGIKDLLSLSKCEVWNIKSGEDILEKKEKEEKKENGGARYHNLIDIVPNRTPTEGLSFLAKELYEIRDIAEHYLKCDAEPLDWRTMIDRRIED